METEKEEENSNISKSNLVIANVVILIVFLAIVGGVYFWVSSKSKNGQQVFPAGINYLSPQISAPKGPSFDYVKLAESSDWLSYKGKLFPYSFQHPKEITPVIYPGDKNDPVAFKVSTLPPEQSLLLTVETISNRDKDLVGKPKEFVSNYWKFFSGLSSLAKITEVTNEKGLKGYKAAYVIKGTNAVTSDNYFFVVESNNDILLHVGDIFPPEGKTVFNRILNSLEYQK